MGVKVTHSSTGLPSINSNSYYFLVENTASSRHGCYIGPKHLPPLLLQSVFGIKLSLSHLIHANPATSFAPSNVPHSFPFKALHILLPGVPGTLTPTRPS